LIIGGDDLTVVLDGEKALPFTVSFLRAFEDLSANDPILRTVAAASHDSEAINWLSASAGVAIVKPHFPFAAAYELAADLTESAKIAAAQHSSARIDGAARPTPLSSVDFHQLLDSSAAGFDDIRARLIVEEPGRDSRSLVRRPYITTTRDRMENVLGMADVADEVGWDRLAELADAVDWSKSDAMPRSQVVPLRETLHRSRDQVQIELDRLVHRYPKSGLAVVAADDRWGDSLGDWLIDALDAHELGVTQ
jgi:hypothetical protein